MNHIIWCTFFQKRHFSEFDYFIKNLFTVKKASHERFNSSQKFHEIQQVTYTLQVGKLWLFLISLVHSIWQKRVSNRFVLCSLVTQGSGLNKVKKNKKINQRKNSRSDYCNLHYAVIFRVRNRAWDEMRLRGRISLYAPDPFFTTWDFCVIDAENIYVISIQWFHELTGQERQYQTH